MKKTLLLLFFCITAFHGWAQQTQNEALNKAYQEGEYAFLRVLKRNISYPKAAREAGIVGLSVLTFEIDCHGNPTSFDFIHPLGYGIEDEIKEEIEKTAGKWHNCQKLDEHFKVELKIAFSINGIYKPNTETDIILNAMVMGDFPFVSDEKLKSQFTKYKKKKKFDKARASLKLLMMRYPLEPTYKALLKELN